MNNYHLDFKIFALLLQKNVRISAILLNILWYLKCRILSGSIDFWSAPSASEIQNGPVDLVPSTSGSQGQTSVSQDRRALLTQSRQGKLCFINPLFLQLEVSKVSSEGCDYLRPFEDLRGLFMIIKIVLSVMFFSAPFLSLIHYKCSKFTLRLYMTANIAAVHLALHLTSFEKGTLPKKSQRLLLDA